MYVIVLKTIPYGLEMSKSVDQNPLIYFYYEINSLWCMYASLIKTLLNVDGIIKWVHF